MIRGVGDGSNAPLGVTLDDRGADIAASSARATAMDLRLLNETGSVELGACGCQRTPAMYVMVVIRHGVLTPIGTPSCRSDYY